MAVYVKSLDRPDSTEDYGDFGHAEAVELGDSVVWRSTLLPGWSWDRVVKPMTGLDACPAYHREYVVSGAIRYHLLDGSAVDARPGDHLIIEPGHRAEVLGGEACVLVDW